MKKLLPLVLVTGCITDGGDDLANPTTVAKLTIFDRLGDDAGPIPGLDGFSIERTADATRCGGVAVRVVRAPGAVVPAGDEAFVRMLESPAPTGLDFATSKEAALNAFKHWFDDTQRTAQDAVRRYSTLLAGSTPLTAVARIIQVERFMASSLARMEIPADIRAGDHADDKRAAFCDQLGTAAEPLVAKADEAVRTCVEKSANAAAGWWSTVCK